ncbi:MAG: phosphomannomutase/phosphoglucomutase [Clostridia bacterium]|nr:phosphomannomutase/phosphoglucomutase [Clostridia bacterium]
MEPNGLKKLKSGTDVRGVAVGDYSAVTLTDEAVILISRAFIKWLTSRYKKDRFKIAVGNDSRISAQRILNCVKEGILSSGCDLVYTGLSSTPSMFILLKKSDWGCDASIMITASHLPYDRNGLKFFTPDGGLDSRDIDEILEIAEGLDGEELCAASGNYSEKSYMDEYSEILAESVREACGCTFPLAGKKIIVDAGNGAGGFFAEKVLLPLGADITGSQFLEPDGRFPNHIPNPEDAGAIKSLSSAVLENGADLGIIFDTDVDRAGAVDSDGKEINRNRLIALISAVLLKEKPNSIIVTDSVTSDGLTAFIKALGGQHIRYKRGYKNVIDKCVEVNKSGGYSPLAMETSGHAAFADNYMLDDGAYLVTRILITLSNQAKTGAKLCDLIAALPEPVECAEVRLTFTGLSENFKAEGQKVIGDMKAAALTSADMKLAPDNYEGARINFGKTDGDGWLLIRQSVHDPVMPVNFESNTAGGNKIMAEKLLSLLESYAFLNVENLKKFISY